jgi:uncharacterized membrane protein
MKRTAEKFTNYALIIGFLVFGAGTIISIMNQVRTGMPVELAMILTGLTLIILGILAAKIFGDVLGWKT